MVASEKSQRALCKLCKAKAAATIPEEARFEERSTEGR